MPNNVSIDELKAKAKELRLNIAQTTFNATSGHVGGSMSSADMLIALYFKYLNVDPKTPIGTRETDSSCPKVTAHSRTFPASL